jgi:gamma-glutamylcyclotransferase (GGCT)/AIG2-like uncharacterized protein YtfP
LDNLQTLAERPASTRTPWEWLFTYGILRDPATVRAILGHTLPGGIAAHVEGYARRTSADGYYYLVLGRADQQVPGILWQVTRPDLHRLDAVEGVDPTAPASPTGEYRRVWASAHTPTSTVPCWLYVGGTIGDTIMEDTEGEEAGMESEWS